MCAAKSYMWGVESYMCGEKSYMCGKRSYVCGLSYMCGTDFYIIVHCVIYLRIIKVLTGTHTWVGMEQTR